MAEKVNKKNTKLAFLLAILFTTFSIYISFFLLTRQDEVRQDVFEPMTQEFFRGLTTIGTPDEQKPLRVLYNVQEVNLQERAGAFARLNMNLIHSESQYFKQYEINTQLANESNYSMNLIESSFDSATITKIETIDDIVEVTANVVINEFFTHPKGTDVSADGKYIQKKTQHYIDGVTLTFKKDGNEWKIYGTNNMEEKGKQLFVSWKGKTSIIYPNGKYEVVKEYKPTNE